MDTKWFATETIRSEDVNLYDEHGEYETGLHLEDLTRADLEMDDEEAAVVTQSVASFAGTFGNSSSVILASSPVSTHSASIITVSSPVPTLCDNCRANCDSFDGAYPEPATISNIGWYCSPVSESQAWFVVSVGRNIGVFDNWFVFFSLLIYIVNILLGLRLARLLTALVEPLQSNVVRAIKRYPSFIHVWRETGRSGT